MKKMNNKGFSLVELIIVIAIMAILVGVLAPQYLKYVEKSRKSADLDTLDSIYTACTTAASDAEVTDAPSVDSTNVALSGSWGSEVKDTLGITSMGDLKFKSKSAGGAGSTPTISYNKASNKFTVKCGQLSVAAGKR